MNKKTFAIALVLFVIGAASPLRTWAEETDTALLTKAVMTANVSLGQGLRASKKYGAPISGKFEIDNGALQLSVYTEKSGKFFEVVIDHKTGKTMKAEPIADSDDLKAAHAQSQVMAKAKLPLEKAVLETTGTNPGYRAVSIMPTLEGGRPVAKISLAKGGEIREVSKQLE